MRDGVVDNSVAGRGRGGRGGGRGSRGCSGGGQGGGRGVRDRAALEHANYQQTLAEGAAIGQSIVYAPGERGCHADNHELTDNMVNHVCQGIIANSHFMHSLVGSTHSQKC